MSEFNLNLFEDRLEAGEEIRWPLAQGYRIIYVVAGEIDIAAAGQRAVRLRPIGVCSASCSRRGRSR